MPNDVVSNTDYKEGEKMFLKLLCVLALVPMILFAKAGSLDGSFGETGIVKEDIFGQTDDELRDIVIQNDGKIIAVGVIQDNAAYKGAIVRFNTDGSIDKSFGNDGKVIKSINGNQITSFGSVKLLSDGEIIVGGYTAHSSGGGEDSMLMRFDNNGTLDKSFGNAGVIIEDIGKGYSDTISDIAIQTDGKIVTAEYGVASGGKCNFALARYDVNGTLDTSFGIQGIVITTFPEQKYCSESVAIQMDEKIIVSGGDWEDGTEFVLVRYDSNGSIDENFGDKGKIVSELGYGYGDARALKIQSDGRIVVAGGTLYDTLMRFDRDGKPDPAFGEGGMVKTQIQGYVRGLDIQKNGKIVAVGGSSNFIVVRLDTNGSFDNLFGIKGVVSTNVGGNHDKAFSVSLQSDGKIVVGGFNFDFAANDIDFVLVRYIGDYLPSSVLSPIYYLLD